MVVTMKHSLVLLALVISAIGCSVASDDGCEICGVWIHEPTHPETDDPWERLIFDEKSRYSRESYDFFLVKWKTIVEALRFELEDPLLLLQQAPNGNDMIYKVDLLTSEQLILSYIHNDTMLVETWRRPRDGDPSY